MMRLKQTPYDRLKIIAYIFLSAFSIFAQDKEWEEVSALITYEVSEGLYINSGTANGVVPHLRGEAVLHTGNVSPFEVLQVSQDSALIRIDGIEDLFGTLRDTPLKLMFHSGLELTPKTEPSAEKKQALEPFVPLLAPHAEPPAITTSRNISHGQIRLSHSFQISEDDVHDYAVTQLRSSGNIDRIYGSLWSFVWSGSFRYRSGESYADHAEYESIKPYIYGAALHHPIESGGFVTFGRFLPNELPGVGYVDGGQVELEAGLFQYGLIGGLKPSLQELDVSTDRPTLAGYVSVEAGKQKDTYYSGTFGLLGSLFDGAFDQLALLVDQRVRLGMRLDVRSTAELDFGVADTPGSETQLSRFNLSASSKLHEWLTLRAGADHWARVDNFSERDLLALVDDRLFDQNHWRYWVGASHNLPAKFRLREELSYIVSDYSDDTLRWRATLSRYGLFFLQSATINGTVYAIESFDSAGMGGVISAHIPFFQNKLSIRPAVGMRWLDHTNDKLSVTYYSVYLDGQIAKSWGISGGLTSNNGDGAESFVADFGLRYRW